MGNKQKIIIANWKMNPQSLHEAKQLFNSVKKNAIKSKKSEIIICPPFVYLSELIKLGSSTSKWKLNFQVGAQNLFWEEKGAFTGEISSLMLKDINCQYVILGHSERRKNLNENNKQINAKIKTAIKASIIPIFCIGENLKERKSGKTNVVLEKQLLQGLDGISQKEISKKGFLLTYEPVWAISTTKNRKDCSPKEAHTAGLFLRKILIKKYGSKTAKKIKILYGGSVDSSNIQPFINETCMEGVLIGGASIKQKEFNKIIKIFNFA